MKRFSDTRMHRLVRNHCERLAVWPADRDLPDGWVPTGERGTYKECMEQIARSALPKTSRDAT